MSAQPVPGTPPVPAASGAPFPSRPFSRVEYLDFQDVPDHREYRLAVYGPEGGAEFRFRIPTAAFGDGRLRLQEGPDVCYQKLLRTAAAGETASPDVVVIDDLELASYREAHSHGPKRPSWTPSPAAKPPFVPRPEARPRVAPTPPAPPPPVAPLATDDAERGLDEGQRVRHPVFGAGVTTSSSDGHTSICFDEDGSRMFVTSMLELEVLSAPHTWETSRRGRNRPRPAIRPAR